MRTRTLLVLALVISAIAFAKQGYCAGQNWQQPTTDIHMCYSDISVLYSLRGLENKAWPYSQGDQSLEYPVLTGVVTYLLSLPVSSTNAFYFLNTIFLIALFLGCAFLIHRYRPEFSYLYVVAPAGVLAYFINWDLWAIISMIAAIIWFDRKRYDLSAVALAVSVATKFMPIFLLLPIALLFFRSREHRKLLRYLAIVIGSFLIINAPVAITTPSGWAHFYLFNLNRKSDWGSLWYALQIFGIKLNHLNALTLIALIGVVAIIALIVLGARTPIGLADTAFITMALLFAINKVYSPQYVLWLIPLAVIALRDKRDLHAFWIWQIGEVTYFVAIWQHLALLAGAKFGLAVEPYGLAIFIRLLTTIYLVERLTARLRVKIHKGAADFLFDGSPSYP